MCSDEFKRRPGFKFTTLYATFINKAFDKPN